ncbi:MAG: ribonuclease III [Salinisphaera sp.]|nr:ribonuclease III [Salinisphaera sp.]
MNSDVNRARDRATLEERLDYRFADRSLLARALTHRSASANHNERLEFLGDGVLNFIIAAALFEAQPNASEGDLSRLRASLVRERTLAAIADELSLGELIVLGPGENTDGSRRRSSIRADTVEAILGAIYCDAGFDSTRRVVLLLYQPRLADLPSADSLKDAKTQLQEWLQARGRSRPAYHVTSVTGADHAQHFVVSCGLADSDDTVQGEGGGRRKAEQVAARRMLDRLNQESR